MGPGDPPVVQVGPEKRFGSVPDLFKNPTNFVFAGLLPGPDIHPRFFGQIGLGPQFHFAVPATLAPIEYLSSVCVMT